MTSRPEVHLSDVPSDRRSSLLTEFNRLVEQKENLGRDNLSLQSDVDRMQHRLYAKLREFGY